MSISGALSIQEVRAVLEALRAEMRPLLNTKTEVWQGQVVEVIGSTVRVARGDEPTTAGSLLRQPYPVVGSMPSVGAQVWAASWLGGGIVITGGTSGATGVTSIEGQSGTVDIAVTGGLTVLGSGGTVTIGSNSWIPAPFSFADPLTVRESNPYPILGSATIKDVRVKAMTSPTTTSSIFEVRKNGTLVSGGTATVATGATTATLSNLGISVVAGDYLTVACTQAHASTMGTKYTVNVQLVAT